MTIISDTEIMKLSAREAQNLSGFSPVQVTRMGKKLKNEMKYREQQIADAKKNASITPPDNHRAEGTGENEWYTPIQYIDAARKVMGEIDLDPATSLAAQHDIQAKMFFTGVENGLSQTWRGRVWLNPPYAQPKIWQFVEKLIDELSGGGVFEAILLTHNYTDTAWFHHAESIAAAICFTRGRIKFVNADGDPCAPTQGQAFFYYGDNVDKFRSVFSDFGFVR